MGQANGWRHFRYRRQPVSNGHNVSDNGDNHHHYHTAEVKHSDSEHPEFPAAMSRLDQSVNRQ